MAQLIDRYATPFITFLFLISLITGLGLFFRIGPTAFREMHEILSLVLILPFGLHLWKNWRPMMAYLRRPAFTGAALISAALMLPFFLETEEAGRAGPPPLVLTERLMAGRPETVAPALGQDEAALKAALEGAGYQLRAGQTLNEIAAANGKSARDLQAVLARFAAGE